MAEKIIERFWRYCYAIVGMRGVCAFRNRFWIVAIQIARLNFYLAGEYRRGFLQAVFDFYFLYGILDEECLMLLLQNGCSVMFCRKAIGCSILWT